MFISAEVIDGIIRYTNQEANRAHYQWNVAQTDKQNQWWNPDTTKFWTFVAQRVSPLDPKEFEIVFNYVVYCACHKERQCYFSVQLS